MTSFGAKRGRSIRFTLISDANLLRKGTRLAALPRRDVDRAEHRRTCSTSSRCPTASRLTIRSVALTVPVLQKTISQ